MNIMTKRRQRHSPEQIVRKIQDADRILAERGDVVAVLRQLNVTEATHYRWRNQFGGLKAEDAKKLKHLKKQNLQLRKLLVEAELEKAVLKELAERVV
jgi:putative transposase